MAASPSKLSRWIPRFSLRTLLILALLIGSAATMWWHWEPWVIQFRFPLGNTAAFSPDCSMLVVSEYTADVVDLKTCKVVASIQGAEGDYMDTPRWTKDGRWLFFMNAGFGQKYRLLWDAQHWTHGPVAELDVSKHTFVPLPEYKTLGYGTSITLPSSTDKIWDDPETINSGWTKCLLDGRAVYSFAAEEKFCDIYDNEKKHDLLVRLAIPGPTESGYYHTVISRDGNWIVANSLNAGRAIVWRRRRPEYWWGAAWLPEFWLTVAFSFGLIWSVWRDRRGR